MPTDVETIVIQPMRRAFRPPVHLRDYPAAQEETLDAYRAALAPFDRDALRRGWLKAAAQQRYNRWPDCPDIVAACEEFQPRKPAPPDRTEEATALEDAYVKRFMKCSAAAVRAREGGYEAELKAYLRECAHVQAQYICGRKDVSYVSCVLFPQRDRDRETEDEWFDRARSQAAKGSIQVRVPQELIETWKAGAERGRGR